MTRRVLVIEDDPDIGRLITLQLAELDCESRLVADGVSGLAEAQDGRYDLVILDLMLPRLDGLQICKRLRAAEQQTPILMLTAKASELDRVLGLELGADDYLTKPFSMLELAARLKGMFRRAEQLAAAKLAAAAAPAPRELIEVAGLSIDLQRHEAKVGGQPVELTAKEFDLLAVMASQPGVVFSREKLLERVWGFVDFVEERGVDVHVRHLREKLGDVAGEPRFIETVRGVGYRVRRDAQ